MPLAAPAQDGAEGGDAPEAEQGVPPWPIVYMQGTAYLHNEAVPWGKITVRVGDWEQKDVVRAIDGVFGCEEDNCLTVSVPNSSYVGQTVTFFIDVHQAGLTFEFPSLSAPCVVESVELRFGGGAVPRTETPLCAEGIGAPEDAPGTPAPATVAPPTAAPATAEPTAAPATAEPATPEPTQAPATAAPATAEPTDCDTRAADCHAKAHSHARPADTDSQADGYACSAGANTHGHPCPPNVDADAYRDARSTVTFAPRNRSYRRSGDCAQRRAGARRRSRRVGRGAPSQGVAPSPQGGLRAAAAGEGTRGRGHCDTGPLRRCPTAAYAVPWPRTDRVPGSPTGRRRLYQNDSL